MSLSLSLSLRLELVVITSIKVYIHRANGCSCVTTIGPRSARKQREIHDTLLRFAFSSGLHTLSSYHFDITGPITLEKVVTEVRYPGALNKKQMTNWD